MPVIKLLKKAKEAYDDPRQHEEHGSEVVFASHDESNWLVSYADMMTLLCGFFIMLFSMATLDPPKYEKVKEAMSEQFGGKYESPHQELGKFATEILQEAGVEQDASVRTDSFGVSLVFKSTVFFDTSNAELKAQGREILSKLIFSLRARQEMDHQDYRVVVEGHSDSRPVIGGPYPSNWELSSARAAQVVRMFVEDGFLPDHLAAIGYADTQPEAPSKTASGDWDEAGLAKNRRVVVRILDPKSEAIPLPNAGHVIVQGVEIPKLELIPIKPIQENRAIAEASPLPSPPAATSSPAATAH